MQKAYFFKITTIFLATITIPTVCMESSSITTEKPKLLIKLRLKEMGKKSMQLHDDCGCSEQDKRACEIFGIKWEENNNRYLVQKVTIKNPDVMQEIYCPDERSMGFPLTIPSHYFDENSNQSVITFPNSLPATFVAQLEKENITLKNCLFLDPIEITLKLGYIKKKKKQTQPTSFYTIATFTGIATMGLIAYLVYVYKK